MFPGHAKSKDLMIQANVFCRDLQEHDRALHLRSTLFDEDLATSGCQNTELFNRAQLILARSLSISTLLS
jgi:hypothetical protein